MTDDSLSLTFQALADPTRRAILKRLRSGAATVQELAEPLPISQPAVSRHLKVLERAGLVERGIKAQWRPVVIDGQPLREASEWLEDYRGIWEQRFDRLDKYLKELQQKDKEKRDGKQ